MPTNGIFFLLRFVFISLLLFIHGTAHGFSYFDNKECAMRFVAADE